MLKIETIYHHLLFEALKNKKYQHTQQNIANIYKFSLSTVNHALNIPTKIGAIQKTSKFFILADFQKLLYYWASKRNFEKDIIFKTHLDYPIYKIESIAPNKSIYACYSSAVKILGSAPADYSQVYFYLPQNELEQFLKRLPPTDNKNKTQPNLFILKSNKYIQKYGLITTLPQTFVDIWNLTHWYSKDFIKSLNQKIENALLP
ncbi:hypothetical protein KKA02_04265 [Patescibacteria group bacterium]|nr:hypothetical protein [Patescibacteria group bacterium]